MGGGARARLRALGGGGGGKGENIGGGGGARGNQTFRWMLTDRRAPPTTSRLQSVPNNDISHNKTDHIAKLRIELKSILLAKPLNWYICDLVFTVSHRH